MGSGHLAEPLALLRRLGPDDAARPGRHREAAAGGSPRPSRGRARAPRVRGRPARRAAGPLDSGDVAAPEPGADLLAVDAALELLSRVDARKAQVVELRFFGGLSIEETAAALGVSPRTVHTDWAFARAWLYRALSVPDVH